MRPLKTIIAIFLKITLLLRGLLLMLVDLSRKQVATAEILYAWSQLGLPHLLAQVRTRVLDDTLPATFQRWYPGMNKSEVPQESALVAS